MIWEYVIMQEEPEDGEEDGRVEDVGDGDDEDVDMEDAERRADERLGRIEYGKQIG